MHKFKKIALWFGAAVASLAVNAIDLEGVSGGAVVTGEWNSNFNACKAKADSEGIPMLLFWSSPGCAKCNTMKKGMNEAAFAAWRQSKDIIFCFSEGVDSVKAFAKNPSKLFPYMRIYWPAGGVDVKFSGRTGTIGASGSTPAAQLMNRVDAELASWGGTGAPQRHKEVVTPVIGEEWSKARKLNGTYWKDGRIAGVVIVATARLNKKKGTSKIKVQIVNGEGKRKLLGSDNFKIDSTTSGKLSNSNGAVSFSVTSSGIAGTVTLGGVDYQISNTKAGGNLVDGEYTFMLDRANYPAKCEDLPVIAPQEILPFLQKFTVQRSKLKFPRKGTMRYDRDIGKFTMSSMENPSGLKFSYARTYGYIKGTFTVFCERGKTSKKYTAKVGGFIVGASGAGNATIKKVGTYPFTIAK